MFVNNNNLFNLNCFVLKKRNRKKKKRVIN